MKNILNILKFHYSKKYQRCIANDSYTKTRYKIFKILLDINVKKQLNKEKFKFKKFIFTNDFLFKTLTFKKTSKEMIIFLKLYKKFNYSLKLKKKYSLGMSKLTNYNEHFSAYIYLGNQIINFKALSELQKLNTILKINDITLIHINTNKNLNLIPYIQKNIIFEQKMVSKYAKKFIAYSS